jgi:hypothetical protein
MVTGQLMGVNLGIRGVQKYAHQRGEYWYFTLLMGKNSGKSKNDGPFDWHRLGLKA